MRWPELRRTTNSSVPGDLANGFASAFGGARADAGFDYLINDYLIKAVRTLRFLQQQAFLYLLRFPINRLHR
jgi:hypothetical protein